MNIVKKALNDVGIRIPIKRRVWNWLRDHPNKTSREIATALNEKVNKVQTELRDMTMRKMVKGTITLHKPYRGTGRKSVYEYAVTTNEYELLPYASFIAPSTSTVTVVKYEKAAEPVTGQVDVDSLSISEARRIYDRLKEIFG